jgi:TRAP-type C4-dicarboxylate transport system permease small subunit
VRQVERITGIVSTVLKVVMILLSVLMIFCMGLQVFARYLFNVGYPWTEELGRFSMIWMVFLGISYVSINSEHINVSILQDTLKGISKKVLLIIQDIFALIFAAVVFYFSFDAIKITTGSISPNTGLSMGTVYLIFPAAMVLLIWSYIYRLIKMKSKKDEKTL